MARWPEPGRLRRALDRLRVWRRPLLSKMAGLARWGIGCAGCDGRCCTVRHNSMKITPIEAADIAEGIRSGETSFPGAPGPGEGSVAFWRKRLTRAVGRYGLSPRDPARRYTCPFFTPDRKCALPAGRKPLGCLAFNATQDWYCETDTARYFDAHDRAAAASRRLFGASPQSPIPLAVLAALDGKLPTGGGKADRGDPHAGGVHPAG